MIIAGFGSRSGVSVEALYAVLREAQLISNTTAIALAVPRFKQHEPPQIALRCQFLAAEFG